MTAGGGKVKKSGKKLGNAGFSLVELIVGVFILAIVVGPLLHAFVVSARTTARAKETRNQTIAAQNIIETLDAASIEAILGDLSSGANAFGNIAGGSKLYTKNALDQYVPADQSAISALTYNEAAYAFGLTGVGGGKYDALVELNAAETDTPIVKDTPPEAEFPQPGGMSDNPDVLAATEFAERATIDSGSPHGYEDFLYNMKRTVYIRVVDKTVGEETKIECTTQYHYETSFTYPVFDLTKNPPVQTGAVTVNYSTDYYSDFYNGGTGEDGRLSLYFFFYPNYNKNYEDLFVIENKNDLKIDVFLVKQTNPYDMSLAIHENAYNAQVKIMQTPRAQTGDSVLNTNMAKHLADGSPLVGKFEFWLFKGDYIKIKILSVDGQLVKKEAQNRLYGVTVTLYKHGGLFGEELMTFDASIIE